VAGPYGSATYNASNQQAIAGYFGTSGNQQIVQLSTTRAPPRRSSSPMTRGIALSPPQVAHRSAPASTELAPMRTDALGRQITETTQDGSGYGSNLNP